MTKDGYQKITTSEDTRKDGFISLLLFQWMDNIFKTGSTGTIEESDFAPLLRENSTAPYSKRLQTQWEKERAKSKGNGKRPKLWKSVITMISINEALIMVLPRALYGLWRLLKPLLLGYLLSSLMEPDPHKNPLSYGCVIIMGLGALIGTISMRHSSYRSDVLGIGVSSALKALIYRKILQLKRADLLKFTTGRVIDLLSNDVQRLEGQTLMLILGSILDLTLVIPGTVVFLVYLIGWQALMGVICLFFLVPYFAALSSLCATLRRRTAAVSDRRFSLLNQVISGIRAIKTHAWEDEFRGKIKRIRSDEMKIIRTKSSVLSALAALEYTSVPFAMLVSVMTLVLTGQPLTPVNVFMLLSFVNVARISLCIYLLYGTLEAYEAFVSLQRIEHFLLLKDLPEAYHDHSSESTDKGRGNVSELTRISLDQHDKTEENPRILVDQQHNMAMPATLEVSILTSKENLSDDVFILQDVQFSTASQELTVITGSVGSGKSTLLSAIAGEVPVAEGTITWPSSLVYVPQTPWVFSGTIGQNILFGQPYNETRYFQVVQACALMEDFQKFPKGDETVVAERGVALSGGQRARVSLARAVYMDADLYLLDDPLSAVDTKVSQHIFERCIKGILCNKTRLLTSHQVEHMKEADEVIVLYKGRLLAKGTFSELEEKGVFDSALDPLCKKPFGDRKPNARSVSEKEKNPEVKDKAMPAPTQDKELQISDEDRIIGGVTFKIYWDYFKSGLNAMTIVGVIFLCFITQVMIVSPDFWLSSLTEESQENQKDKTNLITFGCLVLGSFIFAAARAFCFLQAAVRCSERLHDKMTVAILEAPALFFDSNLVGRILNRFSKDTGCMDEVLPKAFLFAIQLVLAMLSSILVPTVANPWLLFVAVPMAVAVVYISQYYLKTSRQLKRLESINRSPVFSHISDTIDGLETIRTRARQKDFEEQFYRCQDVHTQSYIMVLACERWLGVRMSFLISLLTCTVALGAIFVSQDAAFAGLGLVYVLESVELMDYTVRKAAEVENFMTSVERVMTYTKLDHEPGYKVKKLPPEHWPSKGDITLQDLSMTYYPGGPQVLRNVNLHIKGGTNVGVTGRTGAGKSSLVAALLRMPDAQGAIMIDDIAVKDINLQVSRRCVSVLGQRPVLFSGSLRENLDLVEQFQDVELWRALEIVQLKELVENLEGKLDHQLLEHGANFSVGERQLICLARVLLHKRKIVILDEPTAHVDPDTEQTIWRIVREKLKGSTVITIAHRLNTIKDCDMILVMKDGEIDEFDSFNSIVTKT